MSAHFQSAGYLDADLAYLLGMIVARGTVTEDRGTYRITIEFPFQQLEIEVEDIQGKPQSFDVPRSIDLGLERIRDRIVELLDCDASVSRTQDSRNLLCTLTRRTIGWRIILAHLNHKSSFRTMDVPRILFDESTPPDVCMEFVRGFADVAGNIRRANRYVDERNRVRLDVLNENWQLPVHLCNLIQLRLGVPVQNITWGHPNMGRGFREHQINIFVTPFKQIGFTFEHKQRVLELLVEQDSWYNDDYRPCPGRRNYQRVKSRNPDENSRRLPREVRGHFDAYWQICKALGCPLEPRAAAEALDEVVEEI